MMRVAIIGCGTIADAHAAAISCLPNCEIVGVSDKEELMAKQLYERYRIAQYFHDAQTMLERTGPHVVHITTSPQSHYELGKLCLDAGCHVFIEKPFSLNTAEALGLTKLADNKKLKLTVGTDGQFSPVAIRMRELIRTGYLGGTPIHMEDYYGYDLGEEQYAKALLGDRTHWVRALPGQLLHNNISHGIAKIAEYLAGENIKVIAHGFTSAFLKQIKETEIIDELRIIINDDNKTTAYFTFSSQMRPILKEFRIFGPKNGLIADQNQQTLIRIAGKKHLSYLENFVPLNDYARQYRRGIRTNAGLFLRRELHMKSGLRHLIESFYRSINDNSPVPIPYREIILTTKIMDSIFSQIYS
jgi:predicted dehydrogenase